MNSILPKDIYVHSVFPVSKDNHARYSAVSRTYEYYVATRKDPFLTDRAYQLWQPLNLTAMNEASAILREYSHFGCFSKSRTQVKTDVCRITRSAWKKKDHILVFTITADRFLRNMVRAIAGTMLDIGMGKKSVSDMREIIESRRRSLAGTSVPACGLFLTKVEYPEIMLDAHGRSIRKSI